MRLATFRGGVHSPSHKALSAEKPIQPAEPPALVRIPVQQHIGAPSRPLVSKGDVVKLGQTIAEPGGFVSVPQHASVSGTVKAVASFPHPFGRKALAIEIANDGQDTPAEELEPIRPWRNASVETLRGRVRDAGIVGLGGAGFPAHVKLTPPDDKPIHTLILNGAECEPYLTGDYRLMLEAPGAILEGAQIVRACVGARRIVVAIEDNKPHALEIMRGKASRLADVQVVGVRTKYPQGSELQVIKAVLGEELPKSKLPMEVGVVVHNVATSLAIREAVVEGKPLIERVVTVTGSAVGSPCNLRARIGTLCTELIEQAGGMSESAWRVIIGGPMMGLAQAAADVPLVKGASGILLMARDEVVESELAACIRCSRCELHCPSGLAAARIALAVEFDRFDVAEQLNVLECIECGCCSYVCPARRPMTHLMRAGKSTILKSRAQRKAGG